MGAGGKRLERDPLFALELSYTASKGIPRSTLADWPEQDYVETMVWWHREQERCKGCGTVTDDFFDERARTRDLDDVPWVMSRIHCPGCAELERVRTEHREAKHPRAGMLFGWRRRKATDLTD